MRIRKVERPSQEGGPQGQRARFPHARPPVSAFVLAAGLWAAEAASAPQTRPAATPAPHAVEWIVEDGSNLLLRLVMEEGRKACGGVLTVDPTQRTVRFEGIPGDLGCKRVVEAPFADVKSLRTQRMEAGFVIDLAGKGTKLVLLPLPHFAWFEGQFKTRAGGGPDR